jgi:hypothetical protein
MLLLVRAIALQVVALTIAVVLVTALAMAPVVEPMLTLTLALMVLPFEVIGGVKNNQSKLHIPSALVP